MRKIATVVVEVYAEDSMPEPVVDRGLPKDKRQEKRKAFTKAREEAEAKVAARVHKGLTDLAAAVRKVFPAATVKAVDCWLPRRDL